MTIRSSLEIALERTKDVQADPDTLKASGFATAGKKLVSQFLGDPEFSLAKKVREHDGKERGWVSDGVFDALASNLALPADEYGLKRNRRAMEGFAAILRDQRRLRIMGQQSSSSLPSTSRNASSSSRTSIASTGRACSRRKRSSPAVPAAGCASIRPPIPSTYSSCGSRWRCSRTATAPCCSRSSRNSAACSDAGKPDQSAACC